VSDVWQQASCHLKYNRQMYILWHLQSVHQFLNNQPHYYDNHRLSHDLQVLSRPLNSTTLTHLIQTLWNYKHLQQMHEKQFLITVLSLLEITSDTSNKTATNHRLTDHLDLYHCCCYHHLQVCVTWLDFHWTRLQILQKKNKLTSRKP